MSLNTELIDEIIRVEGVLEAYQRFGIYEHVVKYIENLLLRAKDTDHDRGYKDMSLVIRELRAVEISEDYEYEIRINENGY